MKIPRNLWLLAIVVFVISHFLPAYGTGSGFACFTACWDTLLGSGLLGPRFPDGAWFYYSGFAISNILFVALVVALSMTEKGRRFRSVISALFFLHVFSWLLLHTFGKPSQIEEIKIGYYVWLIAYGLLVAAHLSKERAESGEPQPTSATSAGVV